MDNSINFLFYRCDSVLGEFLRKIKNDPTRIAFPEMINILITTHAQSTDELVQVFMFK